MDNNPNHMSCDTKIALVKNNLFDTDFVKTNIKSFNSFKKKTIGRTKQRHSTKCPLPIQLTKILPK